MEFQGGGFNMEFQGGSKIEFQGEGSKMEFQGIHEETQSEGTQLCPSSSARREPQQLLGFYISRAPSALDFLAPSQQLGQT